MILKTRTQKRAFQDAFLKRAGLNMRAVKEMMDLFPNVGFYIKDDRDRIVTMNRRNCEISALSDEFEAIGRKSSDIFPASISRACLARDAKVRRTGLPTRHGRNYKPVDRSATPTVYSIFPLHDGAGHLIGTMCGFYTSKDSPHEIPATDPRLQNALVLMRSRERAELADWAAAAHMSVSAFRRHFTATFNESPAKYALRLRLNHARLALETTAAKIAEIAQANGFFDQSHFIRAFRACYKVNPATYRVRHQKA